MIIIIIIITIIIRRRRRILIMIRIMIIIIRRWRIIIIISIITRIIVITTSTITIRITIVIIASNARPTASRKEALLGAAGEERSDQQGQFRGPPVREMGGAPRNSAPSNHFFLVRIVKPSGCHCTDGHLTSRVFTEDRKMSYRVPTPLGALSPFSDPFFSLGAPSAQRRWPRAAGRRLVWSGSAACVLQYDLFS